MEAPPALGQGEFSEYLDKDNAWICVWTAYGHAYRHAYGHAYGYAYGHMYGHARRHACIDIRSACAAQCWKALVEAVNKSHRQVHAHALGTRSAPASAFFSASRSTPTANAQASGACFVYCLSKTDDRYFFGAMSASRSACLAHVDEPAGTPRRELSSAARPATCIFRADLFWATLSAHADGERRGRDRIGGQRRKGLGETRRWVPSDRHRSSVLAVGMLRDVKKKADAGGPNGRPCR